MANIVDILYKSLRSHLESEFSIINCFQPISRDSIICNVHNAGGRTKEANGRDDVSWKPQREYDEIMFTYV